MMNIFNILIFVYLFIYQNDKHDFEKGKKYYQKRSEKIISDEYVSSTNIDSAIFFLEKSIAKSYDVQMAELYLKSVYFKAVYTKIDSKTKQDILKNAFQYAHEKIKTNPNAYQLHYWYGACIGLWSKESGVMQALKEGVVDKIKVAAEKTIQNNPNYEEGGGHRFLGILHIEVPYIPFIISWPSDKKGIELINKSLEINPNNIDANYYLAKGYNEIDENEKAIEILKKTLEIKPNSNRVFEDKQTLKLCKQFLNDLQN